MLCNNCRRKKQPLKRLFFKCGARNRNRTGTLGLGATDFKSVVSTNSTTRALWNWIYFWRRGRGIKPAYIRVAPLIASTLCHPASESLEAKARIELASTDLQSAALPLCYFASDKIGAGNESRTRDLNLGKVALYQLSYSRFASYCSEEDGIIMLMKILSSVFCDILLKFFPRHF